MMLNSVIVFKILCALSIAKALDHTKAKDEILNDEDLHHFNEFNVKFNRNCKEETQECRQRKQNFAINMEKLRKMQKEREERSFTVGIHPFMDESEKEMKARLMSKNSMPKSKGIHQKQMEPATSNKKKTNPLAVDWRQTGAVNPVKDQDVVDHAGTIATVETLDNFVHCRVTDESRLSYSEQMVMDCTYWNSSLPESEQYNGCDGGWPSSALKRIMITGTETEKQDPYLTGKGVCPQSLHRRIPTPKPITNWANLTGDVDAMVDFVANTAPFAFCMMICEDFFAYQSGIYDSTNCTEDNAVGGHAVAVMGYGTTDDGIDYWLVRNSWGPSWAENGYFKMRRGTNVAGCEDSNVAGPISSTTRTCTPGGSHHPHHIQN